MNTRDPHSLRRREAGGPASAIATDDAWHEFRELAAYDLTLSFRFDHSLGKLSRFFLALENEQLLATRCTTCGKVWMPPRALCAEDQTITTWVELPGRATLVVATHPSLLDTDDDACALGYVRLEGADTLLLQRIRHPRDGRELRAGQALSVVWADAPGVHPMSRFWFEPA